MINEVGNRERIDVLLKRLHIVKSREYGKYACENDKVLLNGKSVKSSHMVKSGDRIRMVSTKGYLEYEILDIPKSKNVKKSDVIKFYKIVGSDE